MLALVLVLAASPPTEVFVGLSTGAGYSVVDHPLLKSDFAAPTLSLVAGAHVTSRVSIGAELQSTAHWVERRHDAKTGADVFLAAATCPRCGGGSVGGDVGAITATFTSLMPRVDVSLFGRNGPFAGVGVGVALIQGLPSVVSLGFAASGHIGVRYRLIEIVELAAEGGVYAQRYSDASIVTPYASGAVRLLF